MKHVMNHVFTTSKIKLLFFIFAIATDIEVICAHDAQIDGICYNFDDSDYSAEVTWYGANYTTYTNKYSGSVIIPASVTWDSVEYTVTRINYSSFYNCTNLTSVTIPNSVTSIGCYAFYNCSSLTSIALGDGVMYIDYQAFDGCTSLTSIKLPSSVTYVGDNIFNNCTSLAHIYVPCGELARFKQLMTYDSIIKYEPFPYKITKKAVNGSISTTMTSSYSICDDSVITCTAVPHNGYHFVQWSDSVTDNPRAITLTQDTTITAEFAKNEYTITTASSNNNWGTTTGDTTVLYQETVTLTATPNYGYHFTRWNDGNNTNPRLLTVTKTATYTATFVKNTYNINKVADAKQGSIGGPTKASYLDSVALTAVPNYGYRFIQWSDGLTDSTRSFVITKDTSFAVEFAKNPAIMYYCDKTMGYITGDTTLAHSAEGDVTFLATPNYGYHFTQWSDGVTDNPRTIHLTHDTSFVAEFALTLSGQCGDSLYWSFKDNTLAFRGCGGMYHYTAEDMPWSLLTEAVQHVDFAPQMTLISEYAFQNMTNLNKVNLSSEIRTIGKYAFANCISVKNLTIPNSVTTLEDSAFYGCSHIDTLIIGTGIETITNQFRGCTSLRYLQLGQNIRSIAYGSFYDARQLIFIVCHPNLPPLAYPDEVGKERSFYNTNAQVLIPCDNFEAYQYDALWGSFNLKCMSSDSGTAVDGEVSVVPGDADATFTWPTDGSADTYNLEITKDNVVFCTLTFNSQGQLLGIAFAPSANGVAPHAPQAVLTTSGMTFQVTGLDYASRYRFSFETKNAATQTLFAYTGSFHTNGTTAPEGFENIDADENVQKILLDGTIYILRGDRVYTLTGQEVK